MVEPLSHGTNLSVEDAYLIAHSLDTIRTAEGEIPIGRKLGFTNRLLWQRYGEKTRIAAPFWSTLFDSTVRFLDEAYTFQCLTGSLQPRIEPEVVFRLAKTPPPGATVAQMADCLEWMAHAVEIVVSPYPEWKFEASDAIAAMGLHGTLLVGEPRLLSAATRRNLGHLLANASVSLSCDDTIQSAGFGSNVWGSPLHALWQFHHQLRTQPDAQPLQAGEIITTGTWTDAYPVAAGQSWSTAFSGIGLTGLTVGFV